MTVIPTGLLKNRYVLHEVIGQGGMAAVHRAYDNSLGRDVAIKMFAPTNDEAVLKRSEDEVNVLATLSHHGLVTLLDAGIDRGSDGTNRVFLVMELVNGTDLQRAITTGPLVPRQIAQIGYDLAEGLQYIHHRGVVHRDVKPSNVLFVDYSDNSTRARVKLTDFGIAHRGIEKASPETVTTGTAAYLSPEQVRRDEVGPPTDIYSLGLVLLECFTGVIAFPGAPTESALARLDRGPLVPRGLSPEWRDLLSAMTARNPAERPLAIDAVAALRSLVMLETGRHASDNVIDDPADATAGASDETAFDRITALAARVLTCPISILTISASGHEWFKAEHGIDLAEIERATGRRTSGSVYEGAWALKETGSDLRALVDPAIARQVGMQFHASTPVTSRDGAHIGVLCVMDLVPHDLAPEDAEVLSNLAAIALRELERSIQDYLARLSSPLPAEPALT